MAASARVTPGRPERRRRAERRPKTGPSPVDRVRTSSKHHLITEGHGIPLAVSLTGGNRNDVTQLIPLLPAVPPIGGRRGRPRRRPVALYADRGYDHDTYRKQVRALGITPVIARRGFEHGSGLGVHRWVVEQSFALLHWFRRLRIHWEIRDDIHEAFLILVCGIICWRRLVNLSLCSEFLRDSSLEKRMRRRHGRSRRWRGWTVADWPNWCRTGSTGRCRHGSTGDSLDEGVAV
ncbi:IS5 family transposase [Streptomyces griseorubiginosus]|uniref:IS5 family transposase n=1 Tax=Streptomyces griseorubiginosus TaxID=67304 RepID=UPI00364D1E35